MNLLEIDVKQFGAAEQHQAVIEQNVRRGLPEFVPALVSHDGTLIVVGSGHSLPTFIEQIRGERAKGRPICAVKGAHDFLCDNGIEPDVFVSIEPRDRRHNVRRKNGHTVYLLASRVAPEMFEYLSDCKVILWHSFSHEAEMDTVKQYTKVAIGGGSTSGLRAIAVGYFMGFRNFILYGFDSCVDEKGHKRFNDQRPVPTIPPIFIDGKEFRCNAAMGAQVNEFQKATYGWLPGIHIEAKGEGAIAALLEGRRKVGMPV